MKASMINMAITILFALAVGCGKSDYIYKKNDVEESAVQLGGSGGCRVVDNNDGTATILI